MKTPSGESSDRNSESAPNDPTPQERLIDLLDYVQQVEKLNRKPTFVVPTEYYCSYEEDLRGLTGIEFDVAAEGEEVWLHLERLKETDPPQPGEKLKPWLILSKSPDKQPALREQISVPGIRIGDQPEILERSALPEINESFSAYLSEQWTAWADYERPRRRTINTYNRLFSIQQAMESEGTDTPLELVWGIGLALWKHDSGVNVVHPILTQLVEITLDTQSLALDVRPRDLFPTLDTDAFAALGVPGVARLEAEWRAHLEKAEVTLSPFDATSFEPLLRASVALLDPSGRYWPDIGRDSEDRRLPERSDHLIVTDTWVLYARRRSPNFLIEDLQRLKKNLESVKTLPGGPAALVCKPADEVKALPAVFFRGLSFGGGETPPGAKPRELYFPKPYNEEQVSIIQKLETAPGVVVQGPPGTGKTHTIANVICHYLAQGKRVLVTSKGEPALAVLREQIPGSVRPLTVALLTDEKDGMRQFEHAIQVIAGTVSRINPAEIEREVRSISNHINEVHARLSAIDQEISSWAAYHMKRLRFGGREVLPEALARHVVERKKDYGWFPDKLGPTNSKLHFSSVDIASLRRARLALGNDLAYFGIDLPAADSFPDGNSISRLHEDLLRSRQMATQMMDDGLPPLADAQPETVERAQSLFVLVEEARRLIEIAYSPSHEFTAVLHQNYRSGNPRILARLNELLNDVVQTEEERQRLLQHPVEIPGGSELDGEFIDAIERAGAGKTPVGLFQFGRGELRAKIETVTVLGLRPRSEADWVKVINWVNFTRRCRGLVARWNSTSGEFRLPKVEYTSPDTLRELVRYVEHIMVIKRIATHHERRLPELVSQVFGNGLPAKPEPHSAESLAELAEILSRHLTRSRLAYALSTASDLTSKLSGKTGAIAGLMHAFLTKELGTANNTAEYAAERWTGFLGELRRLSACRGDLAEVARVSQLVEQSGARNWAGALRSKPALDNDDEWTPADWLEAWQWRQASTFLESIDGREVLGRLQIARRETETDLAQSYQKLVENKTWSEVYKNSPDSVKAALQAYLNAVMHIGKGTGVRAIRYRKEARQAMLEAYRAVPCWVMPQWRVSETLPPEIGKFDLVIVDEASQSDLWALPCLVRGEKLLVVGDDKQVSPDGIGLAEEKIKDLKNRFLNKQVHKDQMTPEKSLYDLAKVVFAGQMVMLREHFRCVAPLIEFSKREFYENEIRPLRIPKSSERLDPPLVDIFVKGGFRRGKVNEAEARAIIEEIKTILADARFAMRSIGVVSLLGIEQAHRIFEIIKQEIPAEEIVLRKITVGDARTFQGKERDIMLMSMVATREEKMTATGSVYEQRFNVAASRARDRMYLFRSLELADLNKIDLKARLIEHFATPFRQDPVKVASLRELCQSGFERDLFDALVENGYRVWPQVKVGAHSIDLVIEGQQDRRLAVECDGDQYHGPEKWSADMARQRTLERAGWTFWRCFSSSFTLKRKAVLEDLFATMKKMGIEPIGLTEVELGHYTEHRTVDPFATTEVIEQVLSGQDLANSSSASPDQHNQVRPKVPELAPSAVQATLWGDHVPSLEADGSEAAAADTARLSTPKISQVFSDEAFRRFVGERGLDWRDNRSKRGALWVFIGSEDPIVRAQLRAWGFQLKRGKEWWRV